MVVGAIVAGCSGSTADTPPAAEVEETSTTPAGQDVESGVDLAGLEHAEAVRTIVSSLSPVVDGLAVADLRALSEVVRPDDLAAFFSGAADPMLAEIFGEIGPLASAAGGLGAITTAVLVRTTATPGRPVLLVVAPGGAPAIDRTADVTVVDLPGGVVALGEEASIDALVGDGTNEPVSEVALLDLLDPARPLTFAQWMDGPTAASSGDRTLRHATAVSGSFEVVDGSTAGELVFHTDSAADFVEAYNALDRNAAEASPPMSRPIRLAEPLVDGLGRVVVDVPSTPLLPTPSDLADFRNTAKKLFAGMEAYDHAEDVFDPGNAAWFDFLVKSELDDDPPSPGSVYIRWEFRDQAAIEEFERNELPAGFRLAPTRFLETDDPDGEYFFALNLYNGGGGMIVGGARAEFDVFVHGPDGADPNAGVRPRFMVVEAVAEEVSADAGNLLTPAEPVSHELIDGVVVSDVRRIVGDTEVQVFRSSFPVPDPDVNEVARFTREMAIGNDYIYWAHGVSDRVLYNATTFNHDAYFVDVSRLEFTDMSKWAEYLKPTAKDAVYYVNTLEYVASPMANLDSDHLDITPAWLEELYGFKNNGHQVGLMRKAVDLMFRGQADALVPFEVTNEVPSSFSTFEITDPEGLSEVLDLPAGHRLAPIRLVEGGPEAFYLTLSVYEVDGAAEGTRAEWAVYTDDGDGRPNMLVLDVLTEGVGFDPWSVITVPSHVDHESDGGIVRTRLSSSAIEFEVSYDLGTTVDEELTMDWIEAGDIVCALNDVCDVLYYDAETLDVPVHRPANVDVEVMVTPWDEFLDGDPAIVFFRDNPQLYVAKRWSSLKVPVAPLPFAGLDGRTHEISGDGVLVGRSNDIADSEYVYTGDVVVDGDVLEFSLDQQVSNALGVGNIFTTGRFSLRTGTGTQTVVDCQGPALLCSDIERGSTAFYTAQRLDVSDPARITWAVDVAIDLGGSFGIADSSSRFVATRVG
ncbi:MAG: hypothetical protein ACO3WU_10980 [Ilumatobacteraceae bacterium]